MANSIFVPVFVNFAGTIEEVCYSAEILCIGWINAGGNIIFSSLPLNLTSSK
jgi:hypothetical protein